MQVSLPEEKQDHLLFYCLFGFLLLYKDFIRACCYLGDVDIGVALVGTICKYLDQQVLLRGSPVNQKLKVLRGIFIELVSPCYLS